MTEPRRLEMLALLMEGVPSDLRAMEEMCADDIRRIEPTVDDIEQQAYLRGQFQVLLEFAHAEKTGRFFLTPF
jgi:hypothetical protein